MPAPLKSMFVFVTGLNLLAALLLLAAVREFGAAFALLALAAYGFGMRHAFDADHIAAIDNVTRRLRHLGRRPVAVGFFFSLGHSSVVILLVLVLAIAFGELAPQLRALTHWGTLVSNMFSAVLLTAVGVANLAVLRELLTRPGSCGARAAGAAAALPLRPFFAKGLSTVDASWKMFPVGLVFGLGFDTATEVALLAISTGAAQSGQFPLWAVLGLPLLFAAGMCCMDTLQSLVMLRVYDWAASDANRSLKLNTVVTGMSVLLALGVAGLRWGGLLRFASPQHVFAGPLDAAGSSLLGLMVSALLIAAWLVALAYRRRKLALKLER